jgi:hypothetical protein
MNIEYMFDMNNIKLETKTSTQKDDEKTTMAISRNNLLKLKQLGHSGMSVNDILERILTKEQEVYKIDDR